MKVLVTGATSLLGAGVARALHERGDDVTVLQRRPSGLPCREVLGDITDPQVVRRAVTGMDGVVHLAALVDVVGAWSRFEAVNVGGTASLVAAARDRGATRFVQVSSPSVAHTGGPLVGAQADPADPRRARSHYARSKALAERHALAASRAGFAVLAVRPHLVWGPGDEQLVGRIVSRARRGRLALIDRGAALIDSTYLDNAVDAVTAAFDRAEALAGRPFVVSNGQPRPVAELLERICWAAGVAPPRHHVPFRVAKAGGAVAERLWRVRRRDDEPPMTAFLAEQLATAHWFDQRETRRALGWVPGVGLDEGFTRLRRWFEERSGSGLRS